MPVDHPFDKYAPVAQLVEQRTENPRVGGSIPSRGTGSYQSAFSATPECHALVVCITGQAE